MAKKMSFRSLHVLQPQTKVRLDELSSKGKEFLDDRERAEKDFESLRDELIDWQRKLYAGGKQSLLVVLQAMDAGGKDGTIRHVFCGVNPQGVQVTPFKAPTEEELAHDFLWRVHQKVPRAGMIGVFNRSHYEDVLVVRVSELVPESTWRPRFEQINHFEQLLSSSGTEVVKIYLHISHKEQAKRFRSRLTEPDKYWKFSPDDVAKANQWDAYMEAYNEMLERCTTDTAPWYVIPADQKWYRNLAVAGVLVETLRDMNPQFPQRDNLVHAEDLGE